MSGCAGFFCVVGGVVCAHISVDIDITNSVSPQLNASGFLTMHASPAFKRVKSSAESFSLKESHPR